MKQIVTTGSKWFGVYAWGSGHDHAISFYINENRINSDGVRYNPNLQLLFIKSS